MELRRSPARGPTPGSNLVAARNLFTYEDHVSLTHGIHRIDAGVWAQRIQNNDNLAQYQYGQASFGSLTSFLQGNISTFTVVPTSTLLGWRSGRRRRNIFRHTTARRALPNLEISLGFRAEHSSGMNEAHGRASNYLFQNGVIETQPNVGNSVFTVNNGKFLPEPRAGIAWSPFSKTVIHAGYGIYHAQLDALSYRLDQNAPFNTTVSLKNVSTAGLSIINSSVRRCRRAD